MPELPEKQRQALAFQVKAPILYTNIAVRDWTAWYKLGLGHLTAPDGYHTVSMLDFPVSMGGYEYSPSPDFPVMVHMERFPHRNNEGLSTREQCRLGRYELLATSFEDIERNVQAQLGAMLSSAGFDPARDIAAITCNRWAHGYAYSYNPLFDPIYENWDDPRYPHMKARQQFGRITIANSDAGADAELYAAVDQGYQAAIELRLKRVSLSFSIKLGLVHDGESANLFGFFGQYQRRHQQHAAAVACHADFMIRLATPGANRTRRRSVRILPMSCSSISCSTPWINASAARAASSLSQPRPLVMLVSTRSMKACNTFTGEPSSWYRSDWLNEFSAALVAQYTADSVFGISASPELTFRIAASGRCSRP